MQLSLQSPTGDVCPSSYTAVDSESTVGFPIFGFPKLSALDGRCWTCPTCDKTYKQLSGLIAHYYTSHELSTEDDAKKKFKCVFENCHSRPYQNANGLAYHLLMVHGGGMEIPHTQPIPKKTEKSAKVYTCPKKCGKAYRNQNGLAYHLQRNRCPIIVKEQYFNNMAKKRKETSDSSEADKVEKLSNSDSD